MKKTVSVLMVLCLLLSICSMALAAGAPKIQKQPTSQTTDKKGKVTFSFKATNFSPNESSWRFINPVTGDEYTGPELREVMADVKGFKLTASNGKQTVTLENVPESMNGWEVYAHLVNNGYKIDTEHVRLWYYEMEQVVPTATPLPTLEPTPEPTVVPTPEPTAVPEPATAPEPDTGSEIPEILPETEDNTVDTGEEIPAEPEGPKKITVTADNVTLFPVDARGNLLEDQAASTLFFDESGNVAIRSDVPVKYWLVNGIRIEPMGNVTGFVLMNVTSDLSVSAKLDQSSEAAPAVDTEVLCQVTCTGCVFTYHTGGLRSVSSGAVPQGAAIIVVASGEDAVSRGYSINGGDPEHIGSTSFRLKIEGDTVITVP